MGWINNTGVPVVWGTPRLLPDGSYQTVVLQPGDAAPSPESPVETERDVERAAVEAQLAEARAAEAVAEAELAAEPTEPAPAAPEGV